MNIVILTGSPHRCGTSSLLADRFAQGAREAGHALTRFDAAFEDVHPCIGCDRCECGKKPCVFRDAMDRLYPAVLEADAVAFVTPLYYHGMSSQIRAAIDRFHGIDDLIRGTGKKAVLLVTAANDAERVMTGVVGTYRETLHYLGWVDRGCVLAVGCQAREDIEGTCFPELAHRLGKAL